MKSVEIAVACLVGVGFLAVFLAGVGIVGLVAFTISQRSNEIAIRLALGSSAAQALVAFLGQFVWPISLGLAAGLILTTATSQIMRFMLYGVSNLDPLSYAVAVGFLLTIILLATVLPARRALKLDIARALHQE